MYRSTRSLQIVILSVLTLGIWACQPAAEIPVVEQWHLYTLELAGPSVSETDAENPFTDYRLMATFSLGEKQYTIPGFYAADGNAAQTGAESGNVWQVRFRPDELGEWTYKVSFRQGPNIAINGDPQAGTPLAPDGQSGSLQVIESDATGADFRAHGRLTVTDKRYLQHAGSGKFFLKGGADSPENFLAYRDFDGTYSSWGDAEEDPDAGEAYAAMETKDFTKTWEPHNQDWREGDPTWGDGKGKGMIGALNYLAGKGMNVVYMLTNNITGDGRDVWPYRDHEDFSRFDCSKLDQWEIVFHHAQKLGIQLHFVIQETENERLLDDGDTGPMRSLYFRELVARFGHHLVLSWNLGEENGPADFSPDGQTDQQRNDMAAWFEANDPYKNYLVIHTHSHPETRDPIITPLLGNTDLDGISLQQGDPSHVHDVVKELLDKSEAAGHQWIVNLDELGPYYSGAFPDSYDADHDTIRHEVLWGTYMAGGAGVEWYFGYMQPPNDLNCEDWRSRDKLWDQTHIAMEFFQQHVPFAEMNSADELTTTESAYCFAKAGEVYVLYVPKGGTASLNLSGQSGAFKVQWYNPRTGGALQTGSVATVEGGGLVELGEAPDSPAKDWAILVSK